MSNVEGVEIVQEIDDFPDYTFSEIWRQKSWDILYKCFFHGEATVFTTEISEDNLGPEVYDQYI